MKTKLFKVIFVLAVLTAFCLSFQVVFADGELNDFVQVGPIWVPNGYCDLNGDIILNTDDGSVPLEAIFAETAAPVCWNVLDGKDLIDLMPSSDTTAVATALKNGTATIIAYVEDGSQISSVRHIIVTNQNEPATRTAKLSIMAEGNGYVYRNYGKADEANLKQYYMADFACGTLVELTAVEKDPSNPKFLYWIVKRDTKRATLVSYDRTYSVLVGTDEEITAVFDQSNSTKKRVEFIGNNLFEHRGYLRSLALTVPTPPYQRNKTFVGWTSEQSDAEPVPGDELTKDDITAPSRFTAEYTIDDKEIYIDVIGGSGSGVYAYFDQVTAELTQTPDTADKVFLFWSKDGAPVCYDTSYTFSALQDCTVSAVFGEPTTMDGIVMVMQQPEVNDDKIAFTFEREVPIPYTFITSGFIVSPYANCALDDTNNAMEARSYRDGQHIQFTKSMKKNANKTYYARGYVFYKEDDEVKLVYTAPKKITTE